MDPPPRHGGAHQPRDAAQRGASPPRPVGDVPGAAALRRRRRAARVPGDLRLARRPPAAAAAAAVPPLRRRPDVRVLLGHDRPARAAGRRRCAACRSRPSSTTGRPGPSAWSRCGTRRRSTRSPGRGRRPTARRRGLVAELVRSGQKTIAFCRSRRATEVVAADVQRRLPSRLRRRVAPYRGGYLAEERRAIEDRLFGGHLDGVVATSALELGIDVGGLDAVVLNGFPGTIASFRQQAGRAGRSGRPSAAVLVAGSDQLDQWMAAHPGELFDRPPEPVVVNPANPFVADAHLRCAAHEKPLTHADERYWPGLLDDVVRRLALDDQVVVHERGRGRGPQALYTGGGWPSHGVGLRVGRRRSGGPAHGGRRRGRHRRAGAGLRAGAPGRVVPARRPVVAGRRPRPRGPDRHRRGRRRGHLHRGPHRRRHPRHRLRRPAAASARSRWGWAPSRCTSR